MTNFLFSLRPLNNGLFAISLVFAVLSFPAPALGADPWEMAFAAKEQILLGNPKAAERLLKLVQSELAHQNKEELDWELFQWTDEKLRKMNEPPEQASSLELPFEYEQQTHKIQRRPWYKSPWLWVGGAAALALWVNYEQGQSQPHQTTEGFQP